MWIERPRLLDAAVGARVVLLGAPGGWGKTTLATQVLARRGAPVVAVRFEADVDMYGVTAAVRRGLRRAGAVDLASVAPDASPDDVLDAMLGGLAQRADPLSFFVDEAQRLVDGAAAWVRSFADDLDPRHTLVVAGRALDRMLLRRPGVGWARFEVADLRFTVDEVAAVIGEPEPEVCGRVLERTDGWPAAVALASHVDVDGTVDPTTASPHLLDRLLDDLLGADRDVLAPIGALPLLDRATVDIAAGVGAFDRVLGAGLPMRRVGSWWVLADPVRAALAGPHHPAVPGAGAIARRYEPHAGVTFLLGIGELDRAAELLAEAHWTTLDQFGPRELDAIIETLGRSRLAAHPALLLHAARSAEQRDPELRRRWVASGLEHAVAGSEVWFGLRAEQLRDRVRAADASAFEEAVALLPEIPSGARAARARTLLTIGIWHAVHSTPDRLALADTAFTEAAGIMQVIGEHRWQADVLNRLAFMVSYHGGRVALAAEQQAASLALLPSGSRDWVLGMTYYSEILDTLGRSAEAEAAARESFEYGTRVGDPVATAFGAWSLAVIHAHRGDLGGTRTWLDEVERSPGNWASEVSGQEFLSFGADLLGALGDGDGAAAYRERCAARVGNGGTQAVVDVVDGRLEAMYGDPVRAIELFERLEGERWATIRTKWIRMLFRALAAHRQGRRAEATAWIERSLELVEQMALPDLPFRHEPHLVQLLADVWPGGASAAPARAQVAVLGRFAVTRGTDVVTPAPGNPATLVKVLALRGSVTAEQAIDLLWPDADASTGRSRLRNLLNRIRGQAGELVVRSAEVIQLGAEVITDVARFDELVERTLSAPLGERPGAARVAMAAYGGELLPGDAYEDWAAGPRERLRRRYLSLVDIVADDALTRGDIDEGMRLLDAAIEHEPLEEVRYERAARALIAAGRRAAARETVLRARAALAEIGVEPSGELVVIGRSLDVA